MINTKDYPLVYLRTVQETFLKIRNLAKKFPHIVKIVKDQYPEIRIEDVDNSSTFSFHLKNANFKDQKVIFDLKYKPRNPNDLDYYSRSVDSQKISILLESWISLINQYNKIKLTPDDHILKSYENEFFENFKLIDEDANEKPYDLQTQLMLTEFLDSSVKVLMDQKVVNKELISEVEVIKEDLPNLTKQETVKKLSRFFAKARKEGLDILKAIYAAAKSELIKQAISGGTQIVKGLLENV